MARYLLRSMVAIALLVVAAGTAGATDDESRFPQRGKMERAAHYAPGDGGVALGTAATNIVYAPLRFALTTVTAELGGITGWLMGGDAGAAQAVWNLTAGQPFVTPRMLRGREPLLIGGEYYRARYDEAPWF